MAGCILLIMGLARLGSVISSYPSPVIVGFTAGIAVIIWIGPVEGFLRPASRRIGPALPREIRGGAARTSATCTPPPRWIAALTLAMLDGRQSLVRAQCP